MTANISPTRLTPDRASSAVPADLALVLRACLMGVGAGLWPPVSGVGEDGGYQPSGAVDSGQLGEGGEMGCRLAWWGVG